MAVQSRCILRLIFLFTCSRTAATQHIRGEEERRKQNELESEIDFERRLGFGFTLKDETSYTSCPQGYPTFGKLGQLLRAWSPNDPEVPEGVVVERLKVLDYSDPVQRDLAETLRDCEVPFKLIGYPGAEEASKKWTDDYLEAKLANCPNCNVMRSESNRFMFWNKQKHIGADRGWSAPTKAMKMPFTVWRDWTRKADESRITERDEHFYLTTGVGAGLKTPPATGEFIADDLGFFSTNKENFVITDVKHQKGIQCRFGARGIIAESHFDHGKNFVLMLRGRKRYLLNPPAACPSLGIINEKAHPSFRHSEVDWSDESDWPEGFAEAPALETVLEAGELLYIPSYWYHYIVSEGFNVQCNARSGLSLRQKWVDETEKCMGPQAMPSQGKGAAGKMRGIISPFMNKGRQAQP